MKPSELSGRIKGMYPAFLKEKHTHLIALKTINDSFIWVFCNNPNDYSRMMQEEFKKTR